MKALEFYEIYAKLKLAHSKVNKVFSDLNLSISDLKFLKSQNRQLRENNLRIYNDLENLNSKNTKLKYELDSSLRALILHEKSIEGLNNKVNAGLHNEKFLLKQIKILEQKVQNLSVPKEAPRRIQTIQTSWQSAPARKMGPAVPLGMEGFREVPSGYDEVMQNQIEDMGLDYDPSEWD